MTNYESIHSLIKEFRSEVIQNWVSEVVTTVSSNRDVEQKDCAVLLDHICECLGEGVDEIEGSQSFENLKQAIQSFSTYRALNNYTPTQTANYLLFLKKTIYELLLRELPKSEASVLLDFNNFIDRLAILSFQYFSDSREEIITSQAYALEHDTPIVKVSSEIVLMPLMGIIDTLRAQKIIEGLLDAVVENQSSLAILDMTAVPTFDTHVANNILKTIMAAKMVGTQVVLSGISPNAALTIVKLGIDLNHVETFSTLEYAMAYAYKKTQTTVTQE